MHQKRVIKIGLYLPKLSQNDCVGVLFLTHSVGINKQEAQLPLRKQGVSNVFLSS